MAVAEQNKSKVCTRKDGCLVRPVFFLWRLPANGGEQLFFDLLKTDFYQKVCLTGGVEGPCEDVLRQPKYRDNFIEIMQKYLKKEFINSLQKN